MPLIVGGGPKPQVHAGHGGCCSGFTPWQGILTAQGTDGASHSLYVSGDRLTLGKGDWATVFTLAGSGPRTVTLKADVKGVAMKGGALSVGKDQADSFGLEDTESGLVCLRAPEGSYLLVGDAGEPVTLTPDAARATAFKLEPRSKVHAEWAADENFPFDEKHSTHLWIFNRAVEWIQARANLGTGPNFCASYDQQDRDALAHVLADPSFSTAVKQGIYDADNSGVMNPATSGFIFSAHFWHPVADRGGWWDPYASPNAFEYGTDKLRRSIDADNAEDSARLLGLAIHYLEDLTQPMHVGMYPNIVDGTGGLLAGMVVRAPEPLPNLFVDLLGYEMIVTPGIPPKPSSAVSGIFRDNYRHENYEAWALTAQHRWTIAAEDLNAHDIRILRGSEIDATHPGGDYWRQAATESLARYRAWVTNPKSPIGAQTPAAEGQIPPFADTEWEADGSFMVKLAQRLVINLLLTWASAARVAAPFRMLAAAQDKDVGLMLGELVIASPQYGQDPISPLHGQDSNYIYLSPLTVGESHLWALETVPDSNGNPQVDTSGPTPLVVFLLRNRQTGKCMVAGDSYPAGGDHCVYHQEPGNRPNALWALVFTGNKPRAKSGVQHPCYKIRDHSHGKWIGRPNQANGVGILPQVEEDQAAEFMLVPRDQVIWG